MSLIRDYIDIVNKVFERDTSYDNKMLPADQKEFATLKNFIESSMKLPQSEALNWKLVHCADRLKILAKKYQFGAPSDLIRDLLATRIIKMALSSRT